LVYFFTSLVVTHLKRRMALYIFSGLTLVVYWLVLHFGGGESPYALETNLPRQIDLILLGESHLWKGLGIAFDPEGLLSTVPATITAITGFLYGWEMKARRPLTETFVLKSLAVAGTLVILAYVWDIWMPINKSLWTSSYVLLTSGLAIAVLACCIALIDLKGWTRGVWIFEVYGRNALTGFVLSVLLVRILLYVTRWETAEGTVTLYSWIYSTVFRPLGAYEGSFFFALSFAILCWVALLPLYRKGIYIKL